MPRREARGCCPTSSAIAPSAMAGSRAGSRSIPATAGCFLVDVGHDDESNIVIKKVKPDEALIAGVDTGFDVEVANEGDQAVTDIRVRFTVADSIPLEERIARLRGAPPSAPTKAEPRGDKRAANAKAAWDRLSDDR